MDEWMRALSRWPGRRATLAVLEKKRYRLPAEYLRILLDNCDNCDGSAVERYWDEKALEHFRSAGTTDPNRREFKDAETYRSTYLDALYATSEQNRRASHQGLPLDSGVRAFDAKLKAVIKPGQLFGHNVMDMLEEYKKSEIDLLEVSTCDWTGQKEDFDIYLGEVAKNRGFYIEGKWWRKNHDGVVELGCKIDEGSRTTWTFTVPIVLDVSMHKSRKRSYTFWRADLLVPGYHYYHLYKSPASALLGLRAHVDLLDTIGELIAASPGPAS
jgi:hypothetical protein